MVRIYISRAARRLKAAQVLIKAAADHATRHGAAALEGYPVTHAGPAKSAQLSLGTIALSRRTGFVMTGERQGDPVTAVKYAADTLRQFDAEQRQGVITLRGLDRPGSCPWCASPRPPSANRETCRTLSADADYFAESKSPLLCVRPLPDNASLCRFVRDSAHFAAA